jgi:hypothetical protein
LFFPSFDDIILLVTLLALFLVLPAQLLFAYRGRDFVVNKLRFRLVANATGVIAITLLLIKAYLIMTNGRAF